MRTTVDIPDSVYRKAKAQAALEGIKFRDLILEALTLRLAPHSERDRTAPLVTAEEIGRYGNSEAVRTAFPQGYRIKGPMIPKNYASPVIRASKVKREEEKMEREMVLADGRAHGHF